MRRFFKICATIVPNEQKKFGAGNKKREKKAFFFSTFGAFFKHFNAGMTIKYYLFLC